LRRRHGWATAEALAAGYDADHDRMTSMRRQGPQVGRWQVLDQGLGQE
jgi:hypothetical protein